MSEFKHPVDLTPCTPHLIAIHFANESYTPTHGQQKMLCDEMWRRYVYHERLVEALEMCRDYFDNSGERGKFKYTDDIANNVDSLLSELNPVA